MKKLVYLGALVIGLLPALALAQAVGVLDATPLATTDAVVVQQTPSMWAPVIDAALTSFISVATVAIGVLSVYARAWLSHKSMLTKIAVDTGLLDKASSGAIAIMRSEAENLRARLPGVGAAAEQIDAKTPAAKQAIVEQSQPKFEAAFADTIKHFGKSGPQIADFLRGRVEQALAKPVPVTLAHSGQFDPAIAFGAVAA